jgi:hypothetical protein
LRFVFGCVEELSGIRFGENREWEGVGGWKGLEKVERVWWRLRESYEG